MKNLLAYTPETFDNLELENFEYAPLAGEMDMEEGEAWKRRQAVGRTPRRFPPVTRKARMIKPIRPKVRLGYPLVPHSGAVNVFPPADDRRPSGQFSSSGNAGGEGSFANAPAQDLFSEHVRWVQETLNRSLGLRLIVDGIMNRETRSAVRMFQERKGLPVTGLVGPDTEEALRAEGGQAAAEPELLEGEWEIPGSGECSCGGREMEEFVFEAEPFGGAEFENEFEVATGRVISYSEVRDERFSVPAQESLMRMSKDPAKSAEAVGLLEAVKSGRLLGIWCVNWKASSDRAQLHGFTWWDVIPKGEDAVLMLDPVNPLAGAPLIAFRRTLDTRSDKGCGILPKETTPSYLPQRLDAALIRAWQTFQLWQQRQIGLCNGSIAYIQNLIPSAYCRIVGSDLSVVVRSKGKPIQGAGVQLIGYNGETRMTNDKGISNFQSIAPGRYMLTVSKKGFRAKTISIIHRSKNSTSPYTREVPVVKDKEEIVHLTQQSMASQLKTITIYIVSCFNASFDKHTVVDKLKGYFNKIIKERLMTSAISLETADVIPIDIGSSNCRQVTEFDNYIKNFNILDHDLICYVLPRRDNSLIRKILPNIPESKLGQAGSTYPGSTYSLSEVYLDVQINQEPRRLSNMILHELMHNKRKERDHILHSHYCGGGGAYISCGQHSYTSFVPARNTHLTDEDIELMAPVLFDNVPQYKGHLGRCCCNSSIPCQGQR